MKFSDNSILVAGAKGMLAQELITRLRCTGANLLLSDCIQGDVEGCEILTLDITDSSAVSKFIQIHKPQIIFNCAAYTNVDQAESEPQNAFSVNSLGPRNLAKPLRATGAKLVHISSDYIFGGNLNLPSQNSGRIPFTEEDMANPCGIYGWSKYFGDEFVSSYLPDKHLIVRTSWLHGPNGKNFVDTIYRLSFEKPELKVVDDQIGSPTWAPWLADVLLDLVEKDAAGTFNASSRGNISWFDLAKEIVNASGAPAEVLPQTTMELARPAPRPAFSTLDVSKLESFLGKPCIDWRQCIASHLEKIG